MDYYTYLIDKGNSPNTAREIDSCISRIKKNAGDPPTEESLRNFLLPLSPKTRKHLAGVWSSYVSNLKLDYPKFSYPPIPAGVKEAIEKIRGTGLTWEEIKSIKPVLGEIGSYDFGEISEFGGTKAKRAFPKGTLGVISAHFNEVRCV